MSITNHPAVKPCGTCCPSGYSQARASKPCSLVRSKRYPSDSNWLDSTGETARLTRNSGSPSATHGPDGGVGTTLSRCRLSLPASTEAVPSAVAQQQEAEAGPVELVRTRAHADLLEHDDLGIADHPGLRPVDHERGVLVDAESPIGVVERREGDDQASRAAVGSSKAVDQGVVEKAQAGLQPQASRVALRRDAVGQRILARD